MTYAEKSPYAIVRKMTYATIKHSLRLAGTHPAAPKKPAYEIMWEAKDWDEAKSVLASMPRDEDVRIVTYAEAYELTA